MKHIPDWVLKFKQKGTEIRRFENRYYLYKITSIWNPKKKRAQKVTEQFLGTITKDGLIKPRYERLMESLSNISIKEYGATKLILEMNNEIVESLKAIFPARWKELIAFAVFRLLYRTPMKNVQTHYTTSFLSEMLPGAHLSPNSIGELVREVGKEREKVKLFMAPFVSGHEFSLVDLTHVFSLSENVISSVPGYNTEKEFLPQIRLIFIFSLDNHMPSYFRMLTGSIPDVSSLVLTVREAGIQNVVVIGDKGFFSESNVLEMEGEKLHYILPLKRNSILIDYEKIRQGDRRAFDGYFTFEKRIVWHYSYDLKEGELKGRRIVVFLDERLKVEEEKDFLSRMEDNKTKSLEDFFGSQYCMGTITIITKLNESPERIYTLLKSRAEIEVMFDTFKNVLNADRTYMRDDYQMEGWMFVNFIALILHYKLYKTLADNSLLKRFSPSDVLLHFSRVHKLKIQDRWVTSEIPKKTKDIMKKLHLPIT